MADFIAFAVFINLLMAGLIYTIRHMIPIRTPVLMMASVMSIIFCTMYPYLASFFVFPQVIYFYMFLVLAGAVLLYFIERTFFTPESLAELSEPVAVGEVCTVMETSSPLAPYRPLLQTPSGREMLQDTVFASAEDISPENSMAAIDLAYSVKEEVAANAWSAVDGGEVRAGGMAPGGPAEPSRAQPVELIMEQYFEQPAEYSGELAEKKHRELIFSELSAAAGEVSGYIPEDAGADNMKEIYEAADKIAADIEKENLAVLENEYNRNMADAEEAAAAIFDEKYNNVMENCFIPGDSLFDNYWGDEGGDSTFIGFAGTTGSDVEMEESAGEIGAVEMIFLDARPLCESHLNEEQPEVEVAGEVAPTASDNRINALLAEAFDQKSAGDLPAAVSIFMRVLKSGPSPRLAMLLCLEMGAIYRDIGQKEQAAAALEMFLARWGANFSNDVIEEIVSSIKQLKGEDQ